MLPSVTPGELDRLCLATSAFPLVTAAPEVGSYQGTSRNG